MMLTGKVWCTTALRFEAAEVGIPGEVTSITSGGRLQMSRITKFNTSSLLHLYSNMCFLHSCGVPHPPFCTVTKIFTSF